MPVEVERSAIENGSEVMELRVPASSRRRAERRATRTGRFKGMSEPEVTDSEEIGDADTPGRKVYLVVIEARR